MARASRPTLRFRRRPTRVLVGVVAGAVAATGVAVTAVAVNAAIAVPPVVAQDAPAEEETGSTVSWSVQPSTADGPDGRTTFDYALEPGESVEDVVRVNNFSDEPQVFHVYSQDAINTPEGAFSLLEGAEEPTAVGAWAAVDQAEVQVPAGGHVDLPFTLTVPANATPGDHAGGIVASLTDVRTDGNDNQVLVENRVGTRVYLRVGGELAPSLRVSAVTSSFDGGWIPFVGGDLTTTYTIENTGNMRLGGTQRVEVDGPLGIGARTVDLGELPELLPGQSFTLTTEVTGVQRLGRLTATLLLDPVALDGAEGDPEPSSVSGAGGSWALPWPEIVVLLIIVLIIVLLRRRSRGRQRRRADELAAAEARGRAQAQAETGASAGASATPGASAEMTADLGTTGAAPGTSAEMGIAGAASGSSAQTAAEPRGVAGVGLPWLDGSVVGGHDGTAPGARPARPRRRVWLRVVAAVFVPLAVLGGPVAVAALAGPPEAVVIEAVAVPATTENGAAAAPSATESNAAPTDRAGAAAAAPRSNAGSAEPERVVVAERAEDGSLTAEMDVVVTVPEAMNPPAPGGPPPGGGGNHPPTGAETAGWLALGVGMMALGALLVAAVRRTDGLGPLGVADGV